MERRFAELRKNLSGLYAFLYRMPVRGADLHNHLSGAVYAMRISSRPRPIAALVRG